MDSAPFLVIGLRSGDFYAVYYFVDVLAAREGGVFVGLEEATYHKAAFCRARNRGGFKATQHRGAYNYARTV